MKHLGRQGVKGEQCLVPPSAMPVELKAKLQFTWDTYEMKP